MSNLTIAEGYLSHQALESTKKCSRKNWKWPWTSKPAGENASFVKLNSGKYCVVFIDGNEKCSHTLPEPGMACIIRHCSESKSKCLFVSPFQSNQSKDSCHLFLEFHDGASFLSWERKMREKLQVYSFDIEIPVGEKIDHGEAVIHVTPKFIAITKKYDKNRYKTIYTKDSSSTNVIFQTEANGQAHVIESRGWNGLPDKIKFYSKNSDDIKNSIQIFKNTSRITKNHAASLPRTYQNITATESDNNRQHQPIEGAQHTQDYRYHRKAKQVSRYTHFDKPSENDSYISREKNSCKPHLYSYINLSKGDDCGDLSLQSGDLDQGLSSEENIGYRVKVRTLSEASENKEDVSKFKNSAGNGKGHGYISLAKENYYDIKCYEDLTGIIDNKETGSHSGNEACSINDQVYDDVYESMSNRDSDDEPGDNDLYYVPPTEEIAVSHGTKYLNEEVTPDSELTSNQNDHDIYEPMCGDTKNQHDCESQSDSQILKDTAVACDHNGDEINSDAKELANSTSTAPFVVPRREKRENHSKPQSLPASKFFTSETHSEDAVIKLKTEEPVKLLVSLFATEMDLGGAWTIGVIIVQRQDTETFKLLKGLEEEYGRHQLTTPRIIDATSELIIEVRDCSDGFEVVCCEPQTLKYSDLQQLGPMKWIVGEFQFLHVDETKPVFKCHVCVGGPEHVQDSNKSVFTSQKIPVVKKFTKPGTSPTSNGLKSRLEISSKNRIKLCQSLDLPSALGNNWKSLAAEIGLDNMQIRIIEHSKYDSCTEQVLQILETNFLDKCNLTYLGNIFKEIGRLDVLELLH